MMISLLILSNRVKKIESNVDNCPGFSEKRYQMICQIQKFLKEGCSYREISKRMGVGRNTIAKYREGDPKELSMFGIRQSKLDPYYDFIIQCLASGWSKSKTVKAIYEKGYSGSISNAFEQLCKIEKKENKCFEPQPYVRTMTECLKYKTGSTGKEKDYITDGLNGSFTGAGADIIAHLKRFQEQDQGSARKVRERILHRKAECQSNGTDDRHEGSRLDSQLIRRHEYHNAEENCMKQHVQKLF